MKNNKIRAKMQCWHVNKNMYNQENVELNAVFSGKDNVENAEDNTYSKATPTAKFTLTIDNPDAQNFFVPNKKYYIDITEAVE